MSTFIAEPGTRLGGRYRLEDRVAATSEWAAWKAIDEILARAVTVFTFAPGFPRIREVLTAARAASRLTDSRLAQVFDVEDDWENAYVVMEWAAGDTLDDLLATGPLEPARGARIVAEAAAALATAHAAGLAHLCLTPGSLRMSQGGGVKVVGLGIDAALSGTSAEDPALTDTTGLGQLLYAALTGHWPGPDYAALPPALVADGSPRRPRQVRAGVPAALDDVTCQALQIGGRDGGRGLRRPADLASALLAVIPPMPPPPASPAARTDAPRRGQQQEREHRYRDRDYRDDDYGDRDYGDRDYRDRDYRDRDQPPGGQRADRGRGRYPGETGPVTRRRSKVRTGIVVLLVLVVVGGAAAATLSFLNRHHGGAPAGHHHSSTTPSTSVGVLTPAGATGFDPLTSAANDPGNENSQLARFAIDASPTTAWDSQEYDSASFGNLKKGSGLILDMGKEIRLSSITVNFGKTPGADVDVEIGNSDARNAAALNSMRTLASATNVSGTRTFPVRSSAEGRYVLIWFTRLPPDASVPGKYMAQVFTVIVRGSSA